MNPSIGDVGVDVVGIEVVALNHHLRDALCGCALARVEAEDILSHLRHILRSLVDKRTDGSNAHEVAKSVPAACLARHTEQHIVLALDERVVAPHELDVLRLLVNHILVLAVYLLINHAARIIFNGVAVAIVERVNLLWQLEHNGVALSLVALNPRVGGLKAYRTLHVVASVVAHHEVAGNTVLHVLVNHAPLRDEAFGIAIHVLVELALGLFGDHLRSLACRLKERGGSWSLGDCHLSLLRLMEGRGCSLRE